MQPAGSLVALVTDFGTRDPYVAAMKGVIASRSGASILDLTHEIAPFDRLEAAVFLHGCVNWLPREGERFRRVIVLCVVDPGVGTERRIAVLRQEGRWLVAPDNGILSPIAGQAARCVLFERTQWDLPRVSSTFHGRDRFAPLAAALAEGADPGSARDELMPLAAWPPFERSEHSVVGTVIAIDRFGNLITDVPAATTAAGWALIAGELRISRWARTYAEMQDDEPYLIEGSRGTIEVSRCEASAADLLQFERGDRVRFERVAVQK